MGKKIEPLNNRLRRSGSHGIFHDTRQDVATLMLANNLLVDKVNELVEEVNSLSNRQQPYTKEISR
jgi:hypothetical protein